MRRILATLSVLALMLSLAGAGMTSAHERERVNHFEGSFELLDWDGTLIGRVRTSFGEPTDRQVVPGTFDVTWVAGAPRFPFTQHEYGVDESHAQLVAGYFGPNDGALGVGAGASGFICDYAAPWNANCHGFSVSLQRNVDGKGTNLVGFEGGDGNYDEWFVVGRGTFSLTYVGPTGG
ncbi:MAG: hypothetical protein WCK58_13205 [Chloroflexota bacterium]